MTHASVAKPLLPSAGEGGRRPDEGGPQSARKGDAHPSPQPRPGRRLRHDIVRFCSQDFGAIEPYGPVPAELLAKANRLLLRGGRTLARAPGWQRAQPFPPGSWYGRQVMIALLKLAYRIDPDAP